MYEEIREKIMKRLLLLAGTHIGALAVGFALGVYFLPILTAPASPDQAMLEAEAKSAMYSAEFTRDLRGSDFFHWGEGTISLTDSMIVHVGKLAAGPDYKLYLTKEFVEHEDEFLPVKDTAQYIGDVKTFDGLLLNIPEGVNISDYTSVVIWCEAFGEFITAAKYQ